MLRALKSKESNQIKMELTANNPMGLSMGVYVNDGTYALKENIVEIPVKC